MGTTTTTRLITDEWAALHPTTQAVAAAVPVIEAQVRAQVGDAIKAHRLNSTHSPECLCGRCCALSVAEHIARGEQ